MKKRIVTVLGMIACFCLALNLIATVLNEGETVTFDLAERLEALNNLPPLEVPDDVGDLFRDLLTIAENTWTAIQILLFGVVPN